MNEKDSQDNCSIRFYHLEITNEHTVSSANWGENLIKIRCVNHEQTIQIIQRK